MRLHKIRPGSNITIRAVMEDKGGSFSQKVIKLDETDRRILQKQVADIHNIIVIEAIRHKNKIINFNAPRVKYSIVAVTDRTPYRWRNVRVINTKLPNAGPVVIIEANSEGGRYERRGAHRASVNVSGHIINNNKMDDDKVLIKDISLGGIGIIVDGNSRISVGDEFAVQYKDAYYIEQHISEIANFNFEAKVVRREKLPDGKILLGCTISSYNGRIMKAYIRSKERKLA